MMRKLILVKKRERSLQHSRTLEVVIDIAIISCRNITEWRALVSTVMNFRVVP